MCNGVWRLWFDKDHSCLGPMIPAEATAINPNEENWEHCDEILSQAGSKI
jgi:hypothetical protein